MTSVNIRPATSADLLDIADLINARSQATVGTHRALIDAYGDLRTARYIPAAAERVVVAAGDGRMAAFAYWLSHPPHVVVEFGCFVHPQEQDSDVTVEILAYVESRARELTQLAPESARVVLQTTVLGEDAFMRVVLREIGFEQVREWVHLELDLTEPPTVDLPHGVAIRGMDPRRDWPAVGAAMDEAFADHWGEMGPDARTLLEEDEAEANDAENVPDDEEPEDDPYSNSVGLCFVAETGGEVIGSCLCNTHTVEWPDAGKLGSLSVRRGYRRTGVGRALTAAALVEFHRRGIRRVITDTDDASFTGANRLYLSFGFRPYRYEQVYEKELRPGVEWRLMSDDGING
jgi:ribosomal protein S18 acetylase RimI-like enzyme